ncbi:unnamed protein product [Sphagnum balticum]
MEGNNVPLGKAAKKLNICNSTAKMIFQRYKASGTFYFKKRMFGNTDSDIPNEDQNHQIKQEDHGDFSENSAQRANTNSAADPEAHQEDPYNPARVEMPQFAAYFPFLPYMSYMQGHLFGPSFPDISFPEVYPKQTPVK